MVRIRHLWRRVRKGVVAAATLAAVAACAIGIPLPTVIQKPHSDVRYPCEHHACGCVDAEACWRDCCCMSQAAKLAWAERAGVTPPAFAVAAAVREIEAESPHKIVAHGCCAAKKQASSCCTKATASSCCRKTEAEPPHGVRIVTLNDAMKCRGLTVSVALLPPSLPVSGVEFLAPPLVRFAAPRVESLLYESPSLAIASPPPNCALT